MASQPDILIFLSDQHTAAVNGFAGDPVVRTPNLDALSAAGTTFDAAYTACPLCVPARSAFLTGQLPSSTGIFSNRSCIPEYTATMMHSLANAGYETVLVGRMHFVGRNQRHGFTKRLVGDFTPTFWRPYATEDRFDQGLGPYAHTLGAIKSLKVVGGGDSPVLAYDRAVIDAAVRYLREDHDRPQCIVIGTYAPHFSYVAPEELYRRYRDEVQPPVTWDREPNYTNRLIDHKRQQFDRQDHDRQRVLAARAAYYGMVENLDAQIGQVRQAWQQHLDRTGREGWMVYTSDHGDMLGERGLQGKQVGLEPSARIPMVIEGDGIAAGRRIAGATSLLDLSPTLCQRARAVVPPQQAGQSLLDILAGEPADAERAVICEYLHADPDRPGESVAARAVRKGRFKALIYHAEDVDDALFDIQADPHELVNLAGQDPATLAELREQAYRDWRPEAVVAEQKRRRAHLPILLQFGHRIGQPEVELWTDYRGQVQLPTVT